MLRGQQVASSCQDVCYSLKPNGHFPAADFQESDFAGSGKCFACLGSCAGWTQWIHAEDTELAGQHLNGDVEHEFGATTQSN